MAKRDTGISGHVQGQWAQQFKRDSSYRQWAEGYSGNTGTVNRATQETEKQWVLGTVCTGRQYEQWNTGHSGDTGHSGNTGHSGG